MGQDYILRMIQQITAMLAGILAKRERGALGEAQQEIERTCLETTGLPLVVVRQSSPEAVAQLLATSGARRALRSILLAELLLQDAELAEQRGNPPVAAVSYRHAFRLLADSVDALSADEQKVFRAKLDRIGTKLSDLGEGPGDPSL